MEKKQKMNLRTNAVEIAVIVIGFIITVFLWWIFASPGIWLLPGLAILFLGIAFITYDIYTVSTKRTVRRLRGSLATLFLGIALVLAIMWHPVLYIWMIPAILVLLIGVIAVIKSLYA
jgi:hypothetical protein